MTPEKRIRLRLVQCFGSLDLRKSHVPSARQIIAQEIEYARDRGELPELPSVDGNFRWMFHAYGGYPQIVLPGSKLKLPAPPPPLPEPSMWRKLMSSPDAMLALVWTVALLAGFALGRLR